MRPLILYHGNCIDGFTAAWAARRAYIEAGQDPECVPLHYPPTGQDTDIPVGVLGRIVVMVDFCTSRDQLLRLDTEARRLLVLDHHASHQLACKGLDFCEFDMQRSGAGLTWYRFFPGAPRPWLVNYVEDRDLWRFALIDSKEINAYIQTQEMTWANWDKMHEEIEPSDAARLGTGALAYLDHYVRQLAKEARHTFFAGHEVPVVNAPYVGTSELLGHLAEGESFAVGWFRRGDGMFQYSLHSQGEVDVSEVAKRFGGGGHVKAAGFTSARPPWDFL
jgi:oligoribonuclease NrnB/cAMP/cGMP phosphodiesterase (DHH superfamily)